MEHIHCFHLLACSHKLDRFGDNSANRQGCTASCVAVKFCQDYSVKVKAVVEFLGCVNCILTCHGVNDEECLVWHDSFLERGNLVHHFLVNGKASCCVDDYYVAGFCLCFTNGVVGNLDNVFVVGFGIDRYTHCFCHNLQLFYGCRTINVARNKHWLLVVFAF